MIEISGAQNDFGVVIDPLDGSSLLDVDLCVGSIIGIYPGHVLEKGKKMIAALYILFGPTTLLVFHRARCARVCPVSETGSLPCAMRT